MIRRTLVGTALLVAAFAGPACDLVFPPGRLPEAYLVHGCFRGDITEPAGAGELTIVLERPAGSDSDLSLTGCVAATSPEFEATLAGMVLENFQTQARLTAMPQGRPAFVLRIERQPAVDSAHRSVIVVNETGIPFTRTAVLPPCTAPPTSCADLGLPLAFAP